MRTRSKLVALSLAIALAACARTDDAATDTAAIDTAPGPIGTAPAPTTTVGGSDTPAGGTGESATVHVPLSEWKISVSKAVIAPGTTTFHAMNQGSYTHSFEIEGPAGEWKSESIPPGGTAVLTPNLTPGTYEIYCPIADSHGNHRQRGMRTTFTVR